MNKEKIFDRLERYSSFKDIDYIISKNTAIYFYVTIAPYLFIHFRYESNNFIHLYYFYDKYGDLCVSNKKYITNKNKIKIEYIKELYILTILFSKPIKL